MRARWCLLLALTACDAGAGEEPEPMGWSTFDRSERIVYMTDVVLPTMRDIFVAKDSERWDAFSCNGCHGPDMIALDYEMPQVQPALPRDTTLEAAEQIDPEMTQFMLDEVFPTMAELLDRDKFNHDTAPDGFRCIGCHVEDEP